MTGKPDRQLIYVADPMCSWCWGFAPVVERIFERYRGRISFHLIVGGLRAYNTVAMDDAQKDDIRTHWGHVAERSGQPFDYAFFEREGFVYDTEPACRAVVAARKLDEARGLAMLAATEKAFYADNRDVTNAGVLAYVAGEIGLDRGAFAGMHASDAARQETRRDFQFSRQLGVQGFPTLIAGEENAMLGAVASGYQPFEALRDRLDAWLGVPAEAA